jgi:hypothetical protein
MKTCKTCKWWAKRSNPITYENGVIRSNCECPFISSDFGIGNDELREYESSPASVIIEDWEHSGWLITGEDFGCILHEEKE